MKSFSSASSLALLSMILVGSISSSANAQFNSPGSPKLTVTSTTKGTLNNQQLPQGDTVSFELDLGNNLDNMGDHWVANTWVLQINDDAGNSVVNLRYRFGDVVDAQNNVTTYKLYGSFVVPVSGSYNILYSGNTTNGGVAGGEVGITAVQ